MNGPSIRTARHHPGSLLRELDLQPQQFLALLETARLHKREKAAGTALPRLTGKNVALVFETPSPHLRSGFEVAARAQGAHVTYLGPDDANLGREESVRDTGRLLGLSFDAIAYHGFAQRTLENLAGSAGVPVWNAGTDQWHPTQMLADVLTMTEHTDLPLPWITCCFLGDGSGSIARSLLVTGALLGMDVRIAAPARLWPPDDVQAAARRLAEASGARLLVTADPRAAVHGADFVCTDAWVSLGETTQDWAQRVLLLLPYQVDERLIRSSGKEGTAFLHPLPSVHDTDSVLGRRMHEEFDLDGVEVTDEVFTSDRSLVVEQASNRLHTIASVLTSAFPG